MNLYDLSPAELEHRLEDLVTPSYRIRQVEEWMHVRGAASFEEMTSLPLSMREELAARDSLAAPAVREITPPAPDGSEKFLFTLEDGGLIEAVYMPMGDRTTLCLSSQAGCAVGCTFCVTGFFGPGRNLTPSEMVGQVNVIRRAKKIDPERLNLVFMGMGEPLLNLENVRKAMEIFSRTISHRRITLSTAGIVPGIEDLARLEKRPNLAISINAPDDARRAEIMPITTKYPLAGLIRALEAFPLERGREITIEYVLLAGYNDSDRDAASLARLIRGLRAKVNAIPFNPDPHLPDWMKRPDETAIDRFAGSLVRHGARVTVRRSKGLDIAAACGQLRGKTERRRRS
ncbi:MAG: 23S rRNA (adenine(2503)-C(2))-methyltransferase RlmN [Thermoanaerobaculia bacterium]